MTGVKTTTKYERARTPIYAMIAFEDGEGFKTASKDMLRIFGTVICRYPAKSYIARSFNKVHLETIPCFDFIYFQGWQRSGTYWSLFHLWLLVQYFRLKGYYLTRPKSLHRRTSFNRGNHDIGLWWGSNRHRRITIHFNVLMKWRGLVYFTV